MARAAQSLTVLRLQINSRFPYRDRTSDGGIGDAAHALRNSDHNPDKNGIYHAYDFDHDPDANGLNAVTLYRELRESRDPRIKYLIFSGRIWFPRTGENTYTGPNAHMGHLHISVLSGIGDTNKLMWSLPMLELFRSSTSNPLGMSEARIMHLQTTLNRWYPRTIKLVIDGDYGPATEKAVRYFQERAGLVIDGVAGSATLAKLGIR